MMNKKDLARIKFLRERRREKALREAKDITLYAGYDHDEYENPWFSTKKSDVEDHEYTASITAPKGTYVMFKWNDEDCYFRETPSTEKCIEMWAEDFQKQLDEGYDTYLEEEYSGGTELEVDEYDNPYEAAQALYDLIIDQYPDGDSNYGVIWKPIEDFLHN